MLVGKFAITILNAKVFLAAKIYKAVIAAPPIRMDDAFQIFSAPDYASESNL